MQELWQIEPDILARGRVDSDHLEAPRPALYAGGAVSRPAADVLAGLHRHVQRPNPEFEHLFYRAIKDHVPVDGRIDAAEVAWLRRMLLDDGTIRDEERKFLHELKGEAGHTSREFGTLFAEAMKLPRERHTCGSGH